MAILVVLGTIAWLTTHHLRGHGPGPGPTAAQQIVNVARGALSHAAATQQSKQDAQDQSVSQP